MPDSPHLRIALGSWDERTKSWTFPKITALDFLAMEELSGQAIAPQNWDAISSADAVSIVWRSEETPPVNPLAVTVFRKQSIIQRLTEPVVIGAFLGLAGTVAGLSVPYLTANVGATHSIQVLYDQARTDECGPANADREESIMSCLRNYAQAKKDAKVCELKQDSQ